MAKVFLLHNRTVLKRANSEIQNELAHLTSRNYCGSVDIFQDRIQARHMTTSTRPVEVVLVPGLGQPDSLNRFPEYRDTHAPSRGARIHSCPCRHFGFLHSKLNDNCGHSTPSALSTGLSGKFVALWIAAVYNSRQHFHSSYTRIITTSWLLLKTPS